MTWGYRIHFRSRPHDYHELVWPDHRDAYRFAVDWFTDDPDVWKVEVRDMCGRRDPFVLHEQRQAA